MVAMNLDKLLSKKIPLWVLLFTIILSLIITILFGAAVLNSSTAKNIALIPKNLKKIIFDSDKEFITSTERFSGQKKKFMQFSNNPEDLKGYLLLSRYSHKKKRSIVELIEIKSNKIIHSWLPDIDKINSFSELPKQFNLKRNYSLKRYRIIHPLLLENGDLVFHSRSPLVKVTACSKMKWFIDKAFHHSTELDSEGNMWVPAINFPPITKGINVDLNRSDGQIFMEDTIEKVSQSGEVLFSKPIIQIFVENNLIHTIPPGWKTGFGDFVDPVHLNDIQPVLSDGEFWKKGDVFVSLKHISMIFLYRPSTNKVLWHQQGPWTLQHDVDVLNDHQISVFNNNLDEFMSPEGIGYSDTVIYDFKKNKSYSPYKSAYIKNKISTTMGGLSKVLKNGDIFVEETWGGRVLRMDKMGNIKWQYINKEENGKTYLLNWSRLLSENMYSSVVKKLTNIKCD